MALTDKDILITPNDGSSTADPKTEFTGANSSASDTITLETQFDGSITTLSYEGSAGQLFSVSNDLSGTIFAVNDSSGIPSLEINNNGEQETNPLITGEQNNSSDLANRGYKNTSNTRKAFLEDRGLNHLFLKQSRAYCTRRNKISMLYIYDKKRRYVNER